MFFEDLRKKWDIVLILACNYAVGKVEESRNRGSEENKEKN